MKHRTAPGPSSSAAWSSPCSSPALVPFYAPGAPDGLERSPRTRLRRNRRRARPRRLPLADYGVRASETPAVRGLAGLIGLSFVGTAIFGLPRLPRRGDSDRPRSECPAPTASLHVAGPSVVHRLPAHVKVAARLAFVFVVVATPRETFGPSGCTLAGAGGDRHLDRPVPAAAAPAAIELPFVAFALSCLLRDGSQISSGWCRCPSPGCGGRGTRRRAPWARGHRCPGGHDLRVRPRRWAGTAATATTSGGDTAFMVRYLEVISGRTCERMQVARESRGRRRSLVWQIRAIADSAGTLVHPVLRTGRARVPGHALPRLRPAMPASRRCGTVRTRVAWARALRCPPPSLRSSPVGHRHGVRA